MNLDQIKQCSEFALRGHKEYEKLNELYSFLFNVVFDKKEFEGGCHLISSISHVLLKEMGIENELCIGNLHHYEAGFFTHSWIEIEGKVFDVACSNPHHVKGSFPVINDISLVTRNDSDCLEYKSITDTFDRTGSKLMAMTFNDYMLAKGYSKNLYDFVMDWGSLFGLHLNKRRLIKKYENTTRIFK